MYNYLLHNNLAYFINRRPVMGSRKRHAALLNRSCAGDSQCRQALWKISSKGVAVCRSKLCVSLPPQCPPPNPRVPRRCYRGNLAAYRTGDRSYFYPENLSKFNEVIKSMTGNGVYYIDPNTLFSDPDGYLYTAISGDGCHPTGKYYRMWADWISYAIAQLGI